MNFFLTTGPKTWPPVWVFANTFGNVTLALMMLSFAGIVAYRAWRCPAGVNVTFSRVDLVSVALLCFTLATNYVVYTFSAVLLLVPLVACCKLSAGCAAVLVMLTRTSSLMKDISCSEPQRAR